MSTFNDTGLHTKFPFLFLIVMKKFESLFSTGEVIPSPLASQLAANTSLKTTTPTVGMVSDHSYYVQYI